MKIFIASSTENKKEAKWIEDILLSINEDDKLSLKTQGWWEISSFPTGKSFYESLLDLTNSCDAAIILAG